VDGLWPDEAWRSSLARPPHVLQVFQPKIGGVPRYVANLAHGLRAAGWRVTVACSADAAVRYGLVAAGFDTLPLETEGAPRPIDDARVARKIARWCRDLDVSLIHGHSTKAGLLVALAGRTASLPSVYTPHTWAFQMDAPLRVRAAYAVAERRLAREFHAAVMTVSESERVAAHRWRVAPYGRVRVIRTGLPSIETVDRCHARRLLGVDHGEAVAVWVGRVGAQKRPEDLVPVARAVAGKVTIAALCAGLDGSPLAKDLRDAGVLVVDPSCSPATLYAAGDIVLHTSHCESCPLVVLEAMMAGLPVVGYWVGGVPEQVRTGRTGYLVQRGDIGMLSQRVVALAAEPEVRGRLGQTGRRRARTVFDYHRMLHRIIETYETVLGYPADAGRPRDAAADEDASEPAEVVELAATQGGGW
jgi:glycosyltransferase involved in cell wall biosynthesis